MKTDSRITLLVEGYPRYGFQLFSKMVQSGCKGVCITRLHPDYIMSKFDLRNVNCYWLSGNKGKKVIAPKGLSQLSKIVKKETANGPGTIILLEGLEYLLLWNDMNKILENLKGLGEILHDANADMIIPVDPLTLEQKDLDNLWTAFPRYEPQEIIAAMITRQPQRTSEASLECADRTIGDLLGSVELRAIP